MRSIDLGKKFLGLALFLALSSSAVLANTLSEVQINAADTGYDIVLKTDNATEMKKVVSSDDKMYIELKNVQASDALNTVYNNVANIENVTIQPVSKEDLKITFKGEGISKSKIYFENVKTTAPTASLPSEEETIELGRPMNSYTPVYNPANFVEEVDQTANPQLNEVLTKLNIDRASVLSVKNFAKKVVNKTKSATGGFDLNITTLIGIMFIAAALFFKPKNKKEKREKIGLSQTNIDREVGINEDLTSRMPQKLNPMMPASSYGVKAYQQSQKNPYMTTNTISNGISGIPRRPLAHPKPVMKKPVVQQSVPSQNSKNVINNTIRTKKPAAPAAKKPMEPSDIDSMKFLETITKIYEKNGRNDLAKGLKDNLKKAQMVK